MKKFNKKQIKYIIEELEGIPKNTKFVGYVINLPETEEFLSSVIHKKNEITLYQWAKTPELAIKFRIREKAMKVITKYDKNKATLCLLLDLGKQLIPITEEDAIEIVEIYTKKENESL